MSRSLVRFGMPVCLVVLLTASGGGPGGHATTGAQPSGWSQLPLAARGPVAAAVASHDVRYRISPAADGLTARNPAQSMRLRFSSTGATVAASEGELGLALRAVGRGAVMRTLGNVEPRATGPNRIVYRRPGVSEWYVNGALGLEQGFLVRHRPAGRGALTLDVGLTGSLVAEAAQQGQTISLGSLVYRGLIVTDARGRTVPARMRLAGKRVLISVADRTAVYPIQVDPFVQVAKLTASDGAEGDELGFSVGVSGDTIAAGAIGHMVGGDSSQGAVYVFTKPGSGWSNTIQTAALTATDGGAGDQLGYSVSVSGDTITAGAPYHQVGSNPEQGAVYVFTKPSGGWADGTQTAELTAADGATGDKLGTSVAIDGGTIVAGAFTHTVGGHSSQGAAYVFTKPGGGWTDATQTAELTASDGVAGDLLGFSVAVSGDTIASGAIARKVGGNDAQGSVYVFTKPGGGWADGTQTAELNATDGAANDALGFSVAVSGDTIVAGACNHTVGGNSFQGAAYVFAKPGGGWTDGTQTAELTAADGAAGDELGIAVGVSGDTIAAGAIGHAVSGHSNQGAVYVFMKPVGGWIDATQTIEATATGGATGDELGTSVAVDVDTIVAGALFQQVGSNVAQGAVYRFEATAMAVPSISTVQQPTTAAIGSSIADQATVTGGASPTGTVTFRLFSNPNGNGTPLFTDTKPLSSGGATSSSYTTTAAGTYYWIATYNGDANNNSVSSGTADGPVTVTKASPGVSNSPQPTSAIVGSSIANQATLTGGYQLSGTVTFKLFTNPNGTGSPLFTDTKSVSSGSATSGTYAATAPGTYYWIATYNGDANNNSVSSGSAGAPVTVSRASPGISNTPQPTSATVGALIADQAAVSGGYQPSGTVTFKLYNNANGSGAALFTDTKSLSSGSATSGTYATTAPGTYYWIATYNGDSNNNSVSSGSASAPVTVSKAAPGISSSPQPTSVTVGSSIANQATVTGGTNPTGTVTFKLYNNPNGAGAPLFTDTKSLSGGAATSGSYATTAPGTYYWVATYNGDANNSAISSGNTSAPVTVAKASPAISTSLQPASAAVGASIAVQATVTGGHQPSGTVTFKLYNNPNASGVPVFTDTKSLSGGSATSGAYSTTAPGTYYWVATYSGDSNNNPVSSGNGSAPVTVTKASPGIATVQQPPTAAVGASLADHATLSMGYQPTGTVTFELFDNPNGAGAPLFSDTKPLSNGSATSGAYVTTATGTYYWIATYNGDANNNSVSSGSASAPVPVKLAAPEISTSEQPTSATVGSPIADQATVSSAYPPAGTVTFTLYDNPNGAGTPLFTDTEPLSNGSATSAPYAPTAVGTVYWVATYNGDANNTWVSSGNASAPVTVAKATPSLQTKRLPASAKVGTAIADKVTVRGGYQPSGKITFRLYKNPRATGKPLFTSTKSLSHGSATSARYKPRAPGKYYWVATYSGDARNTGVSSGRASQRVTVRR